VFLMYSDLRDVLGGRGEISVLWSCFFINVYSLVIVGSEWVNMDAVSSSLCMWVISVCA
jgi:hypothetical protein